MLNIDSTWQTGWNTFVYNPAAFPNPAQMYSHFHSLGLKVTNWITGMINIDSPNYQYAFDNGFFLNGGQTIDWWKGTGSFVDYTNPHAMEYWHGLMKNVLEMGCDGWKVDGTDPHFLLLGPNVQGYAGKVTSRQYSNDFYGDFFNYTKEVKGTVLMMARPVDFYRSFAPKYSIFSGWVGDEDDDFGGLRTALTYMLHSGQRGYVGFGSDIGGYRCCQNGVGREKEPFVRWAQLGAFNSLMENGGGGEHRPWMFDKQTADIYRKFVDIHYELV